MIRLQVEGVYHFEPTLFPIKCLVMEQVRGASKPAGDGRVGVIVIPLEGVRNGGIEALVLCRQGLVVEGILDATAVNPKVPRNLPNAVYDFASPGDTGRPFTDGA